MKLIWNSANTSRISENPSARIWSRNDGKPTSDRANISGVMNGNGKFSSKTVKSRGKLMIYRVGTGYA